MSTTAKFIRADDSTHEALQQLAKEHKLSNTKLLAAMVEYFRVTKADPQQPTGPDLTTSLAKLTAKLAELDKRTIGFIREQEKTYLKPILAQVQAHQVLSSPAPNVPAGLSDTQVREVGLWFMRVLLLGMTPDLLSPKAVAGEPELSAAMEGVQQDPALNPIKSNLLTALKIVFRPEVRIGVLRDKPSVPPA